MPDDTQMFLHWSKLQSPKVEGELLSNFSAHPAFPGLTVSCFPWQEAIAMGIPAYALPALGDDPTLDEARAAQQKLDDIVASYTSANI